MPRFQVIANRAVCRADKQIMAVRRELQTDVGRTPEFHELALVNKHETEDLYRPVHCFSKKHITAVHFHQFQFQIIFALSHAGQERAVA